MTKVIKKAIKKKVEESPSKSVKEKTAPNKPVEYDPEALHLITQQVYTLGLCYEGRRLHKMGGKKVDVYCEAYKPSVRRVLKVLIQLGILNKDDIKVPKDVPVRAEDTGSDGIPRWIKDHIASRFPKP